MYKVIVFVPVAFAKKVKEALFNSGCGRLGNYEKCSWESLGTGQFLARTGANPTIGSTGKIEEVAELRIETICSDEFIHKAIAALRLSHPYEEPAFDIIKLESIAF